MVPRRTLMTWSVSFAKESLVKGLFDKESLWIRLRKPNQQGMGSIDGWQQWEAVSSLDLKSHGKWQWCGSMEEADEPLRSANTQHSHCSQLETIKRMGVGVYGPVFSLRALWASDPVSASHWLNPPRKKRIKQPQWWGPQNSASMGHKIQSKT